ncbi:outer membrane beta-barrel protein [Spirosoma soli]|uniref:Outer membrane beta-barrel protein n=1 Tax=Spirosoma soli TaxID=1770529 RepID=A0ABW5LYL3_9BACT
MKRLLLIMSLLITSISAVTAQTEKGRWTVGVSVGNFQYSSQNNYHSFSGSLSPSAGYFFAKNLVVGTGLPLSLSTNKYQSIKASNSGIGLSPFVRYYFGDAKLKPYVGLSYAYSKTWQRNTGGGQDYKGEGYTSSLSPSVGLAYFINNNVALNAGLGYVHSRFKSASGYFDVTGQPIDSPASTSNYFSLGIGFQIFFGK